MNVLAYERLFKKFYKVNWIWFVGFSKSTLSLIKKLHLTDYVLEIKVLSIIHIV